MPSSARSLAAARVAIAPVRTPRQRLFISKPHRDIVKPVAPKSKRMKLDNLELTWLGTCAGSPSRSRNVSASALRLDSEIWLFDAGEATQHQFVKTPHLRIPSITKIFLTHNHGDHVFGLVPLLCALEDTAGGVVDSADPRRNKAAVSKPVDIYGLSGIRRLVRTTLQCTYTRLPCTYRVHELLFSDDKPCTGHLHHSEREGRDVYIDKNGSWLDIVGPDERMQVSAVPIKHTVPCVGFVLEEYPRAGTIEPQKYLPAIQKNAAALLAPPFRLKKPIELLSRLQASRDPITLPDGTVLQPPPLNTNVRKLVILGDTYDAESTAMDELAKDADLVVHESTNAYMPGLDDTIKPEDTQSSIREKARRHGHSTPEVAGAFAKRIRAKSLFLNHISGRYLDGGSTLQKDKEGHVQVNEHVTVTDVGPPVYGSASEREYKLARLRKIEQLATAAWDTEDRRAIITRDLMTVEVKAKKSSGTT